MIRLPQDLQDSYRELLDFVASFRGVAIEETPLKLTESGSLNAFVTELDGHPEVVISTRLIALLDLFNSQLFFMGIDTLLNGDSDLDISQALADQAIQMILRMSPPEAPPPVFERIFNTEEYFGYRQNLLAAFAAEARAAPHYEKKDEIREQLEEIAQIFSDRDRLAVLLEWQVKFLLLHEIAHFTLGHTRMSTTLEHELEADIEAARIFFHLLRAKYRPNFLDLTPVAILLLLLVVTFIEDLADVANRGTRFALKEDFKTAYREVVHPYPPARERAANLLRELPSEFSSLVQSTATIADTGLFSLKRHFRLGLVDVRYFKWYCRVRAIEMTAAFVTQGLEESVRRLVIEKSDYQRGWDSLDLKRGGLREEIFGSQWFMPSFPRRFDGG